MTVPNLTWASFGSPSQITAHIDFGFTDKQNRSIGCLLIVEKTAQGAIYARLQSTRNGKRYGATATHNTSHASIEEAKEAVIKRAEQSRKRQAKAHVNNVTKGE